MAITNARMQMRRGLEADFDPDKMQPGEWAVSLDKKYVRMCFSVGVCVRMATYDAFEEDMAQIEEILSKCETIEEAVAKINTEVSANAQAVEEYTEQAKKYRDEAKQFRDEAETFKPDGYAELQETVASNTAKIDTIIEKAELNIKNTAKGKNLHLTDSANSKVVEFGLYGKAEQFVGTITDDEGNEISVPNPDYPQDIIVAGESYNLLENTATHKEENGVVFVVNEDKSISVSGTSTVETALKTAENTLENGEYILSGRSTSLYVRLLGYNSENTWVKIAETNNSDNVLFTIDNSIYSKILVQTIARNNATFDNETIYPMIRKASVKNDRYMPYGKGSVEVVSCGKNLLKNTEESQTINGVTFTVNEDGSVTANGTATATAILYYVGTSLLASKNNFQNMILSGCPSGGNANSYALRVQGFNNESVGQETEHKDDIGNGTVIPNTPYSRLYIRIASGYTAENLTFYPMIRLASDTDDTYEPYTETTSTIPTPNGLCGIKVSSGGNYTDENGQQWICDEVVKYADGSGKRIERIKHYSLAVADMNNSEEYPGWKGVDGLGEVLGSINGPIRVALMLNIGNACNVNTTTNVLYLPKNIYGLTQTEWKEKYPDMAVDIYLAITTPIITDLSAEEIAEIEKLHTFYPVTNISNDSDCGMSITYKADAQNYIDNRLALIESAMLNNI